MLYVFFVGSGTMMTFDMKLAMSTVAVLQEEIEKSFGIPIENQVLLISGGATLDASAQVCNYGAGMDTNPIFLFSKYAKDTYFPTMRYSDSEPDYSMKERVQACANMTGDFQALTVRTQLARDFAEIAIMHKQQCSELVDSQHLQQQGWAAVVANLEDTMVAFKRHIDLLQTQAEQYFQSRPLYQDLLQKFPDAIDLLARVPILPPLISQIENEDESSSQDQTLFTKFCTEPRAALEKMAEHCQKWINQFDEGTMAELNIELKKILHTADDQSMKEVKGIEDRLFQLNRMMEEAKHHTDNQTKHAEAVSHNQSRVSASNDTTILRDLCKIHEDQLAKMLNNYLYIRDIRDRVLKAKYELCENLKARIIRVSMLQNDIFNFNNKVAIYRENLRRLSRHLDIIHQIHLAPTVYAKTLAEIHRRKNFSNRFLKWAKNLSEQALDLYTKEDKARKDFSSGRTENFVNDLFPGMDDLPPTFATECPEPFDQLLPDISQEDLEKLKNQLPELSHMMEVPPIEPMPTVSCKSIVSDSAFSSEVPSSQAAGPSCSGTSLHGGQLLRTETLSSFGTGECVGPASPTSSPFEEPFLPPSADMDVVTKYVKSAMSKKTDEGGTECKRLHLIEGVAEKEMFSPIVEEQNNVESDGDEFERVDDVPKLYDAFVTCSETSDDDEGHKHKKSSDPVSVPSADAQLEISKAHKGDGLEPCSADERLRTPDSMVTSHDFQSPDYFIDDSMPSSYTESTGTSALGRAQHRVKSHHIIVAELQHQLDEKHSALVGSQKLVQDVQAKMNEDLQKLRDHVAEERSTVTEEISSIMTNIGPAITDIFRHVQLEKENAIKAAIEEKVQMYEQIIKQKEKQFKNDTSVLIIKNQDCHQQLLHYMKSKEELEQDHDNELKQLALDYQAEKAEIVKRLMLEHELELESHREETAQLLQLKESQIAELTEAVSEKQTHIHMLGIDRETFEAEMKQKLLREHEMWMEATESSYKTKYEVDVKTALEQKQRSENEQVEMLKAKIEDIEKTAYERYQNELAVKLEEREAELRANYEKEKKSLMEEMDHTLKAREHEFNEFRLTVDAEHQKEIESITAQFRLAHSTVAVDQMPADNAQGGPSHAIFSKGVDVLGQRLSATTDTPMSIGSITMERLKLKDKSERVMAHLRKQHSTKIKEWEMQRRVEEQSSFNKAISDLAQEKEKVMGLEYRVSFLERKLVNANSLIKSHFEKDVKKMSASTAGEMHHSGAKSKMQKFHDAAKLLQAVREVIDTPLMMNVDCSLMEDKVQDLERELKLEKLKMQNLLDQVQKKDSTNKISVFTCNDGDIVLFLYQETIKNYVAFHYSCVPHFLHPDSLEALNLKIPPENKEFWVITVVYEKEYCQAKKPGNRYKVSPGSKFYRVKVRAWDYEEAKQRMRYPPPMTELTWMCSTTASTSTPSAQASDTTNSSHMSSSAI